MTTLDLSLILCTLACILVGSLCICCARTHSSRGYARWGRRGFLLVLLGLGAATLVAATARADGLAPLGLVAGLLVAGMLWEGPTVSRPASFGDELL